MLYMKNLTKLEKNWILYDVANSAFVLMVSTIIQIFFNGICFFCNDCCLGTVPAIRNTRQEGCIVFYPVFRLWYNTFLSRGGRFV